MRAAGDQGALGASFYDLRLSDAGEWDALSRFRPGVGSGLMHVDPDISIP